MKDDDLTPVYYRVSPALWRQRTWTDDMRLLACYLLTSPHRNIEGLFILPKGYVTGDLKWSSERLAEPFGRLAGDGFLGYDDDTDVCLIMKALKYQHPDNPNMVTSAVRRIVTVPETPLDEPFFMAAVQYYRPLAERLAERLPERFGKPQLSSALLNSALLSARDDASDGSAPSSRAVDNSENGRNRLLCCVCGEPIADKAAPVKGKGLRHATCRYAPQTPHQKGTP